MGTNKEVVANGQTENPQDTNQGGTDTNALAEQILAEARAEADKILADARVQAEKEAKKAARSEAAIPVAPERPIDSSEELVPIRLFKDNDKYKDDVFVAVNGERIQIKRGETVYIKRKFADVLEQSMKQDTATANMIERESAEYAAKSKALNLL